MVKCGATSKSPRPDFLEVNWGGGGSFPGIFNKTLFEARSIIYGIVTAHQVQRDISIIIANSP